MAHQVRVIAHRGASHARPENTIPAFVHAVELGVDYLEFDVRLTADNHPIILHDPTVDRTTDGTGAVSGMTLREIRRLDAGGRSHDAWAGAKVPTLDEVLDLARSADVACDVQIYATGIDREVLTANVVRSLADYGFDERTFVAAEEDVALLARRIDPERPICNLSGQRDIHSLDRAAETGSHIVQAFARYITPKYVEEAHAREITVNVFYADHISEMTRLIAAGVDGILTNEPELLLRHLGRLSPTT